ncbi:MAG: hypothetical protein QW727_00860 [Candidatus Pacearchaeota archaeon]
MKINFRKVGSVIASAAMLGSTMGIAVAASYPGAFTAGGAGGVAIVTGSIAASSDFVAATEIGSNLNSAIAAGIITTGGSVTTSGETKALFTGSSKIYMNDSISINKATLTKTDLPTILADGEFNGNVDSEYTQRIILGSYPRVIFGKMPTTENDPLTGINLGTTVTTQYLYNMTVTFDEAVNFTHSDSKTKGTEITLFGQKFTVAGATDSSKLVLLKSAQKITLGLGGNNPNPVQSVTVNDRTYTVELTNVQDDEAIIKVTDSNGQSSTARISEGASRKVQGLEVAVNIATESTALSSAWADIIVGTSKVTLQDGEPVKVGSEDKIIDGTQVDFVDTTYTGNITRLVVQVAAPESDKDAITPAMSFVDPVFGGFKVDFPGLNIANEDETAREMIEVKNSGSDKMTVKFTDYNKGEITFNWVYNRSNSQGGIMRLADSNNRRIIVAEMSPINKSEYVMVGNEDEGGLYQVVTITNSSGFSDDSVELRDVITGKTEKASITAEGSGTIVLNGKTYEVSYFAPNTLTDTARTIRLNYPDSSGNSVILYPTIETSKGAKIAFYEPLTIDLMTQHAGGNLSGHNIKFPDGDGYTDAAVVIVNTTTGMVTIDGNNLNTGASDGASSTTKTVGRLTYNFTSTGVGNNTKVYLQAIPGVNIVRPAIILFEEKDDQNNYEAVVITLDSGYDGDSAGIGVQNVIRTWGLDGSNGDSDAWNDVRLESNDDLYQDMDRWGTIITADKSDSDQTRAVISYPDEQVYAQVYVSSSNAVVSSGNGGAGTVMVVRDNEVDNIANKNLIVVGGSCVNTLAAELLGSSNPLCGRDFTARTNVGVGEYLIETFSRTDGKIATLVAGYEADDTRAAARSLVTNNPEIASGVKYKGSTSGSFTRA